MRIPVLWLVVAALVGALTTGVITRLGSGDEPATAAPGDEVRAAVLFPGPVRFFEVFEGYLREEAEASGITLQLFDAGWSPETQAEQLSAALSSEVDVVAIAAVDNLALESALREADEVDIPLVTFTNSIGDDPEGTVHGILAHVGRNELYSGELLAQQIRALSIDDVRVASIEGSPGTTPQRLRHRGLTEAMAGEEGWTLVAELAIDDWRADGVEQQVEVLLAREDEIDVIATQWADAAVIVADVLARRGRKDIAVVTLEFTEDVRDKMVSGEIASTALSSIRQEAELTVLVVTRAAAGTQEPGFVEVDQRVISGPVAAGEVVPEW